MTSSRRNSTQKTTTSAPVKRRSTSVDDTPAKMSKVDEKSTLSEAKIVAQENIPEPKPNPSQIEENTTPEKAETPKENVEVIPASEDKSTLPTVAAAEDTTTDTPEIKEPEPKESVKNVADVGPADDQVIVEETPKSAKMIEVVVPCKKTVE